jgi:hypothetical protein
MVAPLLLAAGALVASKTGVLKKVGLGGGKKMLDVTKGPLAKGVTGLGVGTLANVADKKFLGGTLTRYGISLGKNVNGKPLTLNATDLLTYYATTGGFKFSKKDLVSGAMVIGAKKIGELYDWIDPPMLGIPSRIASLNAGVSFTGSPGMVASGVPNLNLTS